MSHLASFRVISAALLLLCLLPARAALADTSTCSATDPTSLQACITQLEAYDGSANLITEIDITAWIPCSGNACNIVLNASSFPNAPTLKKTGVQQPPQIVIAGIPGQDGSAVGLLRTDGFDYRYSLIDITGLSNVTISNFTIREAPTLPANPIVVDGTVNANGTMEYPTFCAGPGGVQGIDIAKSDLDVTGCPVPGYVTVRVTDASADGGYDYPDINAACFDRLNPGHFCNSGQISINGGTNVTISNMVLDHAQGGSVDVGTSTPTVGFYFLNNTVENAYFRGLTVTAQDLSIEGNTFFANRAAGLRLQAVSSSSDKRPSDVSFNIFDHDQHGDAFDCAGGEGCSGGQFVIMKGASDLVVYGNTFLNGFDDFYDPNVFEEADDGTVDAFTGCDLSQQCAYYVSAGVLTNAGQLWKNGGGVDSGTEAHGVEGPGKHLTPDVELSPVIGGDVIFSNNYLSHASYALSYHYAAGGGPVQLYNNEASDNAEDGSSNTWYFSPSGTPPLVLYNNCTSSGCGSPDNVTPYIRSEGPTTAAAERANCGVGNCLWATVAGGWAPGNSLALGSNGGNVNCALKIYAPGGGALLTTIQGSAATCTSVEGVFDIPGSVAQHYTSVQIAYENVTSGQVSAKMTVPLAGMTPTITGTGLGCANDQCIWITATDTAVGNCAVGIYTTGNTWLTTLSGSQLNCTATSATFYIPASILNNYSAVKVNYQNLNQGTWTGLTTVTISTSTGGGSGGGGGTCGGSTGIICP